MIRVLMGVPSYGKTHWAWEQAVTETMEEATSLKVEFRYNIITGEAILHRARSTLFAHFLADPTWTHYWCCDSDLYWEKGTLTKLLKHTEKTTPIVGAAYAFKTSLGEVKYGKPVMRYFREPPFPPIGDLFPVKYLSDGFMFMTREVLLELCEAHPELEHWTNVNPEVNLPSIETFGLWDNMYVPNPDNDDKREDIPDGWALCERFRRLGYYMMCDSSIKLAHWENEREFHMVNSGKHIWDGGVL